LKKKQRESNIDEKIENQDYEVRMKDILQGERPGEEEIEAQGEEEIKENFYPPATTEYIPKPKPIPVKKIPKPKPVPKPIDPELVRINKLEKSIKDAQKSVKEAKKDFKKKGKK